MKVTIGIPAYNEGKNITSIINKLKESYNSIIVCDDGSTDSTLDILKGLGVIIVKHEKNLGYGAAINSIFKKSVEIESDVLVTFDADGQHRIEDVEKILEPILNDSADIVIGSRFLDNKTEIPNYRKFGIKVITGITNASIKNKLTDSQSGLRAYNQNVLSQIFPSELGMGISTEILIKASNKKLRITEVPIKIIYSGDTSTHNPVSHGTSVLVSTIKFTSIEHPLKFYGIPSLVFFGIGLFFTYLSVQFYSEVGRLSTNLTLIAAVTMLLAVVLVITAILLFALVNVVRDSVKS
jgi:glycosyltransferase involved in cell wall biosynthesis|tara:strand:+ start:31 stop:915 length:885 start_codon:yes stop_codon:yes gene_type:complete